MANGDDDLGFVPAKKPTDDLGFVPAKKPAQSPAPPPGLLQRIGQGLEKWWTTPSEAPLLSRTALPGRERTTVLTSPREKAMDTVSTGAMAASPLLGPAALSAPGATLLGLGGGVAGGVVGSAGGRYLGEKIGAPTLGQDVGGLTGSLLGGGLGSKGPGMVKNALVDATGRPQPLARLVLGSDRARALGELADPELAASRSALQSRFDALRAGQTAPGPWEPGMKPAPEPTAPIPKLRWTEPPKPPKAAKPTPLPPLRYTQPPAESVPSAAKSLPPLRYTQPPAESVPSAAKSLPPLRYTQPPEPQPAPGRTRIGSFDFPTTVPESESVPGAKGEAWSMQRTSSPELQRAVESGDPGAIETARRLNPNYRPIVIPKGASLEPKPLPSTGPPQAAGPKPYTIANAMGIRWAKTPGLPDISIPNNMADEDIPAYVAEKQALQSKGVTSILGNK